MDFKKLAKDLGNSAWKAATSTTAKNLYAEALKIGVTALRYTVVDKANNGNVFSKISRAYDNYTNDGSADKKTMMGLQACDIATSMITGWQESLKVSDVTQQINEVVVKINNYKDIIKKEKLVEMARKLKILETAKFGEIAYEDYYIDSDAFFLPDALICSTVQYAGNCIETYSLTRQEAHQRLKELEKGTNILQTNDKRVEVEVRIQEGVLRMYKTVENSYEKTIQIFDVIISDLDGIVAAKEKVGKYNKLENKLQVRLANILRVKGYLKDLSENTLSGSPTRKQIEAFRQQAERNLSRIANLQYEVNKL